MPSETKDSLDGAIQRNSKGHPTGILSGDATALVADLIPPMTRKRKRRAYVRAAELYASRGWTNIHSMSTSPRDIPLLHELARDGKLKIRVYNSVKLRSNRPSRRLPPRNDRDETHKNTLITNNAITLYSDGSLTAGDAAMFAPYAEHGNNLGPLLLKPRQTHAVLDAALRNGVQVNTYAVGDRAVHTVLNWYEASFKRVPKEQWAKKTPRWRIEGADIISSRDIPRFSKLDVIPSMQPSQAIKNLDFATQSLGTKRVNDAYIWQSLINSGSIIAGGSHAPIGKGDPRVEFYAATQRSDLKGYSPESWNNDERVTQEQALKMLTAWPALAAFQESKTGTLEVGKMADITILDTDIMTADGPEILTSSPLITMVEGRIVFDGR